MCLAPEKLGSYMIIKWNLQFWILWQTKHFYVYYCGHNKDNGSYGACAPRGREDSLRISENRFHMNFTRKGQTKYSKWKRTTWLDNQSTRWHVLELQVKLLLIARPTDFNNFASKFIYLLSLWLSNNRRIIFWRYSLYF